MESLEMKTKNILEWSETFYCCTYGIVSNLHLRSVVYLNLFSM